MLSFLRGISIFLFIASAFSAIVLIIGIVTQDIPFYFPLAPLIATLALAIFLTIWIPRQRRKIAAILMDIRENGFRTIATLSLATRRTGTGDFGERVVAGFGLFFSYTDENGIHRNARSRERFNLQEVECLEKTKTFPIMCRGKWVVILRYEIDKNL